MFILFNYYYGEVKLVKHIRTHDKFKGSWCASNNQGGSFGCLAPVLLDFMETTINAFLSVEFCVLSNNHAKETVASHSDERSLSEHLDLVADVLNEVGLSVGNLHREDSENEHECENRFCFHLEIDYNNRVYFK